MAHGIHIARVNTTSQATAIVEIKHQNRTLHSGLKIKQVSWPWVVEGKLVSTLHLDLFCPTAANRLLEEGLLEDLCMHTCEVYNRTARLTQCFHCQAYGHVARACKNMTKCAHCAGEHSTQDCRRADNRTKVRCANCRQQGHMAWMKACPV